MKIVSPSEEVGQDVIVTVLSQTGHCGAGYQPGDKVSFCGYDIEGKLCIHALYSLLPKVFAMKYGATFPWLDDPDVTTHACPDATNPVVFELRRIPKKE